MVQVSHSSWYETLEGHGNSCYYDVAFTHERDDALVFLVASPCPACFRTRAAGIPPSSCVKEGAFHRHKFLN